MATAMPNIIKVNPHIELCGPTQVNEDRKRICQALSTEYFFMFYEREYFVRLLTRCMDSADVPLILSVRGGSVRLFTEAV